MERTGAHSKARIYPVIFGGGIEKLEKLRIQKPRALNWQQYKASFGLSVLWGNSEIGKVFLVAIYLTLYVLTFCLFIYFRSKDGVGAFPQYYSIAELCSLNGSTFWLSVHPAKQAHDLIRSIWFLLIFFRPTTWRCGKHWKINYPFIAEDCSNSMYTALQLL